MIDSTRIIDPRISANYRRRLRSHFSESDFLAASLLFFASMLINIDRNDETIIKFAFIFSPRNIRGNVK